MSVVADVASEYETHVWDVVVIGAGAGGATAGFAAARRGRSVLFLERGKRLDEDARVVKGTPFSWTGDEETALRHGWWPQPLFQKEGDAETPNRLPIGCGTGGSTALFGMVMDRLRPEDFTPRRFFPEAPDTSLPEAWPITSEELEPFYDEAERLYRVHGTPDSLNPAPGGLLDPPSPSAKEQVLSDALSGCGLHPYRIHYARDRAPDCSGCPAMLCSRECRNDAARICLRPAIEQHGARLLTNCRVLRLEAERRELKRAICDWNGRRVVIRSRVFVLAANAFLTPAMLLRSANDQFPDGLANSSGLVGRNLMLHVSDFLLLRLKRSPLGLGPEMVHGLSLNDFYFHDGAKLGNIHAHSTPIAREGTLAFLQMHVRAINLLPARLRSAIASVASYLYRSATVFATVVEDLPYAANRVTPRRGSDHEVTYEYHYPTELRARNWKLFQGFSAAVRPRFTVRPLQAVGMLNTSHACGTCRFGDDPATSVLDRDNRAHDLDNLYVLDASFFPSSGGIGPSLTIVANSLRVGEQIARRL